MEAATEVPDVNPGVEATGAEAGTEFIGLLDGADTIDAVVDAHLIIFARAAALFACKTNSLFPVKLIHYSHKTQLTRHHLHLDQWKSQF